MKLVNAYFTVVINPLQVKNIKHVFQILDNLGESPVPSIKLHIFIVHTMSLTERSAMKPIESLPSTAPLHYH